MPTPATAYVQQLDPPPGARLRVLSDLHLAHERCEAPGALQLAPLLEGVDILVIAGDLSETRGCDWQEDGLAQREQLHKLCRERGVQLITLAGNHDPDAGPILLSLWGGRAIIMHGHALYKEGSPWSWEYLYNRERCDELIASYPNVDTVLEERLELAARLCCLTRPIMRREGVKNRYLRGLLHCFFPLQRPFNIVWAWLSCGWRANDFANRFAPQAELVVFGHFHRSGRWRFGKRCIVNTGAWFRHATPWYADLQDGRLVDYRKAFTGNQG